MTDEELKKIKKKFTEKMEYQEKMCDMEEKIWEYEQNPVVKEYIKLHDEYEKHGDFNLVTYQPGALVEEIIHRIEFSPTNDIYVYKGTYVKNSEQDIIHGSSDLLTNEDNPNADYKLYINLELKSYQDGYAIEVPINECKKFEEEHNIIHVSTRVDADFYFDVRREFFKTAIEEGQEKAVEKILTKYKSN